MRMPPDHLADRLSGHLHGAAAGLTYRLRGDADIAGADALRNRLLALLDEVPGDLVLDASGVSFIDSAALSSLLAVSFAARKEGRAVVLDDPSEPVRNLVALTGVEDFLRVRATDDEGGAR